VPAGQHDPDWPRQWGASDYSPGFDRHLRDLDLLRAVQTFLAEAALADSRRRAEPAPAPEPQPTRPPPPPDALLGEGEEWVWEDDDVEATEATEADPGKSAEKLKALLPPPAGRGPVQTLLPDGTIEEISAAGRSIIIPAAPARPRGLDVSARAPGWSPWRRFGGP
jgi:hypothetical protein